MIERLPANLEVAALCRRVNDGGGFATVLHRGDPDRGEIVLFLRERGQPAFRLERRMNAEFLYEWAARADGNDDWERFIRDRTRIDPDCWLIELDIADAERFVAEMTGSG